MAHSLDRQKTKKLDPEDTGLLTSAIMGEEKKKKKPLFSFHQKPGCAPETNVNCVSSMVQESRGLLISQLEVQSPHWV